MNKRVLLIALGALFSQFISASSLCAQENKKPEAQPGAPSIQQQIDELKEGQQRMLKELAEIKKLLQERSGRVDSAAKPTTPNVISLNVHGEPFKGDSRARVVIMEYSDFDCSFCAKYASEIYPRIDQDYIKPGKIRYYFRDLPEPAQTNSFVKACAARCAGEQGKFWEMHDLLFAAESVPAGQAPASYAQALGLDIGKFSECLASGRYSESIRRSAAGAGRMGIFGTPAFLIGALTPDGDFMRTTKVFLGAESYEAFKSILDELLTPPTTPPTK
jgi:protein-disulfide isomerase